MTPIDIYRRYTSGMSYRSLANVIGVSVGSIANSIRKARGTRNNKREYAMRPKIDGQRVTLGTHGIERMVYAPSVAYVKGLENYRNFRYRMVGE